MTTESPNHEPGNHQKSPNKHPYLFYWLTGGLAAIIAVAITHPDGGNSPGGGNSAPGGGNSSPRTFQLSSNTLLTNADMEQAAGGSWSSLAANPQSLRFSCFPLPAGPSKFRAVELSEALGARLYEVVDSFPSTASASQAYTDSSNSPSITVFENNIDPVLARKL